MARGLRFGFGKADRGDLRLGIGAAGNVRDFQRVHAFDAGDFLDAQDAFMGRLMRQPRRSDQIADRINAGNIGAAPFIDHDMAAIRLDAQFLQPDILDIAGDADRQDDAIDFELLCAGRAESVATTEILLQVSRPFTSVLVNNLMPCAGKGFGCQS